VPLRDLVQKFSHMRFEPMGRTENREIPVAQSIVDYIFRWLASQFLGEEEKQELGILTEAERARLTALYGAVQPELVPAPVQPVASVLPPVAGASDLASVRPFAALRAGSELAEGLPSSLSWTSTRAWA